MCVEGFVYMYECRKPGNNNSVLYKISVTHTQTAGAHIKLISSDSTWTLILIYCINSFHKKIRLSNIFVYIFQNSVH